MKRVIETGRGLQQVWVAIRTSELEADEYPALFLFFRLYAAGPNAKVLEVARSREKWVYSLDARLEEARGQLILQADVEAEHQDGYVRAVAEELRRLQEEELPASELEAYRSEVRRLLRGRLDRPWGLVDIAWRNALCGEDWTVERLLEGVESVTPAGLRAMAQKLVPDTVYCTTGEA